MAHNDVIITLFSFANSKLLKEAGWQKQMLFTIIPNKNIIYVRQPVNAVEIKFVFYILVISFNDIYIYPKAILPLYL